MKIAHVTATFLPYYSGTGMVCYHSALELARRGHDVTIYTSTYPPGNHSYPSEITVRRLPTLFRFGNAPFLPGLLKIEGFDIIHLHFPFIFGAELITVASMVKKIPFVLTYHNDLQGKGYKKPLFDIYSTLTSAFIMGQAKKLIAVNSEHAKQCQHKKFFIKYQNKTIEIPNGVDTTLFHPNDDREQTRRRLGIPTNAKIILFVGVLDQAHHYKGLNYLINVFASLSYPQAKLLVVGAGNMLPEYQRKVIASGLSDKVIFTGMIPNDQLPCIYRTADVLIITSSNETFGIVAIEAMACGLPVIAHDIPGVGNVVAHDVEGLLTPLNDQDQLMNCIRKILDDKGMQQRLGKNGIEKIKSKYSWPVVVEKLENVYKEVIRP